MDIVSKAKSYNITHVDFDKMIKMVDDVLLDPKNDLFTIEPIAYDKFRSMLNQLKEE